MMKKIIYNTLLIASISLCIDDNDTIIMEWDNNNNKLISAKYDRLKNPYKNIYTQSSRFNPNSSRYTMVGFIPNHWPVYNDEDKSALTDPAVFDNSSDDDTVIFVTVGKKGDTLYPPIGDIRFNEHELFKIIFKDNNPPIQEKFVQKTLSNYSDEELRDLCKNNPDTIRELFLTTYPGTKEEDLFVDDYMMNHALQFTKNYTSTLIKFTARKVYKSSKNEKDAIEITSKILQKYTPQEFNITLCNKILPTYLKNRKTFCLR